MDPELTNDSAVSQIESLLTDDLDMVTDEVEKKDDTGDTSNKDPDTAAEEPKEKADEAVDEEGDDEEDPEDEESEESTNTAVSDETLVDIQIGDDTYEVNFAELRAGYLRNEDYAQKVQALNTEHDQRVAELEEKQSQLLDELRLASVIISSDTSKYDSVDWEALKQADPDKYRSLKLEAMEAKESAQKLEARRRQVDAMHQKAQELKYQSYLAQQRELADKLVPGYNEPETFKALVAYGKNIGYTEEDILNIADARHLLLLHNSAKYAEGVVRKKEAMASKVERDLPAVVKPGATKPKSSTDRQVMKSAKARLNSERSVDAAAAYLMTLDL